MTKVEFIKKLQDILETDTELSEDIVLDNIAEWDSLSMMAVMAFFYKTFSISLIPDEVKEMTTVGDLIKKAGL